MIINLSQFFNHCILGQSIVIVIISVLALIFVFLRALGQDLLFFFVLIVDETRNLYSI